MRKVKGAYYAESGNQMLKKECNTLKIRRLTVNLIGIKMYIYV